MKTILILLLLPLFAFSQKNVNYKDIDFFLLNQDKLVYMLTNKDNICFTFTKGNKKSNLYDFLTIGKAIVNDKSYNIDIYYNEFGIPKRINIVNPPYLTMGMWNLCLIDSHGILNYIWNERTYRVWTTINTITMVLM